VSLADHDGGLLVRVEDDGVGFTPRDVARAGPTHIGLLTMRERAELAGGWFEVESSAGEGTTVTFWLPAPESIVTVPEDAGAVQGTRS
jgi:signal transduction histidine kinase